MVQYKPFDSLLGLEAEINRAWEREWLYWYNNEGNRLPAPEEVAQ